MVGQRSSSEYADDEEAWVLFQRAAPVFVVVPLNPMLSNPYRKVVAKGAHES